MDVQVFSGSRSLPPAQRPQPPVRLDLAQGLLEATQVALRNGSAGVREAIVVWAGRPTSHGGALVSHLLLPRFVSRRDYLTIPQAERVEIANYLRAERLLAFADLHTHPRHAFLSAADIAAPFSVRDGFYAIVVPNFAAGAPGVGWRLYEVRRRRWSEASAHERVNGWTV